MLNHRTNVILKSGGDSKPAWGASFQINVYPVGATVVSGSGGTWVVDAGHSFRASDKCLHWDGSTATITAALDSVTATGLVWNAESYSFSAGDLLVNLGADTGTTTPNYDKSKVVIWSDADGGTVVSNSLLTCDTRGNYDYYHKGDGRFWEVARDSAGAVVTVIDGFGGQARHNIVDYGADPAGIADCAGAITAAFVAATEMVNQNPSVSFDATLGQTVYAPGGDYNLHTRLEMESSAINLDGDGQAATTFHMTYGTRFINWGDAVAVRNQTRMRDFRVNYNNAAYNGVTWATAPSADTIAIYVNTCDNLTVDDVTIYFDENNIIQGLTGFKFIDTEQVKARNCRVYNVGGDSSGNEAIGFHFDGNAAVRGNSHFDSCLVHDAQVGFLMESSGSFINALELDNFKVVNANQAAGNTPKYGIWVGGGVRQCTVSNCHLEAADGSMWVAGIYLDADKNGAGAIRNFTIDNAHISRADIMFKADGAEVRACTVSGIRTGAGNSTTFFDIGANVTDSTFLNADDNYTTTGTFLSDSSAADSRNIFKWSSTGAASTKQFTVKGDIITGDPETDTDSNFVFARTSGNKSLKWDESEGIVRVSGAALAVGGGATGVETGLYKIGWTTQSITLSVAGATTVATNMLPARSLLDYVVVRCTTTVAGITSFSLGESGATTRFLNGSTQFTADDLDYGLVHIPSDTVQATEEDLHVTCNATPSAGVLRVTVFYRQFVAPTE